jgi:hypothetical protein
MSHRMSHHLFLLPGRRLRRLSICHLPDVYRELLEPSLINRVLIRDCQFNRILSRISNNYVCITDRNPRYVERRKSIVLYMANLNKNVDAFLPFISHEQEDTPKNSKNAEKGQSSTWYNKRSNARCKLSI